MLHLYLPTLHRACSHPSVLPCASWLCSSLCREAAPFDLACYYCGRALILLSSYFWFYCLFSYFSVSPQSWAQGPAWVHIPQARHSVVLGTEVG